MAEPVVTVTSTTELVEWGSLVLCNSGGSSFTVTLPSSSGNEGKGLTFVRTDGNILATITIAAASGEAISGASSRTLTSQFATLEVRTSGATCYQIT
jgi:hypothetical protein